MAGLDPRLPCMSLPGPRPRAAEPVYAALDLGTNNCRLLVARAEEGSFRVIDAFSRIVRLGERLALTGSLSPAAMDRAIDALRVCAGKLRRRTVTHFRGVATEACRRAHNGGAFLARVARETGIVLDVIAPDEEASLALAGCAPLLDGRANRALLFDIGGGSTEVIWLARDGASRCGWTIIETLSMPAGVVSFAERYGGDSISPGAYAAMVEEIVGRLDPFERRHAIGRRIEAGEVQMLGTSGTVTTIAGVKMDLARYERARVDGCRLDIAEIRSISALLAGMDWHSRAAHPCIGPSRADLVVGGCAILEGICRLWPVSPVRVADRGLREGIILGLMGAGAAAEAHPSA